jgi:hypothetical protein
MYYFTPLPSLFVLSPLFACLRFPSAPSAFIHLFSSLSRFVAPLDCFFLLLVRCALIADIRSVPVLRTKLAFFSIAIAICCNFVRLDTYGELHMRCSQNVS